VIEHDLRVKQVRIYVFAGNLRAADLGFEDLRRIALRHGTFAMAFTAPQAHVEVAATDSLDAGVEDADAGPIVGPAEPLAARVGDRALTLVRLNDQTLFRSGASRYLTAVSTSAYEVSAYLGVIDAPESLPAVTVERLGIAFAGALGSAKPQLERTDALIGLSYQTSADYLVFELAQGKRRKADASRVDALVRTSLAPGTPYAVSRALLTDVAGQGCWSREHALEASVHQISRNYQQRTNAAGGDWAVSYERIEVVRIAAEHWTMLLGEPQRPSYCNDLE
jgi:hypothetical protein